LNQEITHKNNEGTRPSILGLIKPAHRIFALIALIVEAVVGYVIVKSSGFVQIFALILFFVFMLTTIILIFLLSYRELNKLSKEVEKISKEKDDAVKAAHGIVKYWPSRDDAIGEIKNRILNSKKEIFISGIVLSSLLIRMRSKIFIEKLARQFVENVALNLTIVVLSPKAKKIFEITKKYEKEIGDLNSISKTCLNRLRKFRRNVSDIFGEESNQIKKIRFRYYSGVLPHHFIVKLDDKLYVSSYFSHGMGSAACLLELSKIGKGCLYDLFEKEIEYIKRHSRKFDP